MTSTIETEDVVELVRVLRVRSWKTRLLVDQKHFERAADTIERLREENARLRDALEPFAKIAELREGYNDKDDTIVCVNIVPVREARAALNQQ